MADPAVAANGNNLLRESVTRIPLYTGDGTDSFTPTQWLARVEKARLTAAWNEENTMAFIYVSLRGKALKWYECLERSGIANTFVAFSAAFLASFSPATTVRTATVSLNDIKQQPTEDVVGYYARVIEVINEIEGLIPVAARNPAAAAYHNDIVALAGFAALDVAIRVGPPQAIFTLGMKTAMNHVGIQIFVAGLKPHLRDEIMKDMPGVLWDAFQSALTLEKIHTPVKSSIHATVNEISEDSSDIIDGEIEAVQAQLGRLQARRSQFKPNSNSGGQFNRSGGFGSRQNNSTSQQSGKPLNLRDAICRCCNKKGHMQDKCFTRIRKGLPCVDAKGVPLRNQPPTPPPQQGRVAEVDLQNQSGGGAQNTAPPSGFSGPPQSNGYWTPYPPNFL